MKRIHDTNLLNTIWIRESKAQVSYGFVLDQSTSYVLRFVRICWIRENRLNLLKIGWIRMYDTKQIFPNWDSWTTIRYKSGVCIVRYKSFLNLFEVRICTHNTVRIHGFVKRIPASLTQWHFRNFILVEFRTRWKNLQPGWNLVESIWLVVENEVSCCFQLTWADGFIGFKLHPVNPFLSKTHNVGF
jgi:hypothetical protein